jgi:glycosyltransferase involved in cell wall biosynthesis
VSGLSDVAVIVPCFNHGEFVGEAVQSALDQDAGRPRVVVVDDGSTEQATIDAIEALPDEVQVIRQENAGRSAARNAGAAATDARFLLMLDADDRLPTDSLGKLRRALEADPKAGFAYGRLRYFGAWSSEIDFPDFDAFKLLYRSIAWIGLVRRKAFEEAGGFDTSLAGYEDWDLVLGMVENGWGAAQLDDVVLEYRRHAASMLEGDRANYRANYRALRRKHARLFERSSELAHGSDLSPFGRLTYRTFWAWRPVPARIERAIYARRFK